LFIDYKYRTNFGEYFKELLVISQRYTIFVV